MRIEGFSKYELGRTQEGGWQIVGPRGVLSVRVTPSGHPVVAMRNDEGRDCTVQIGRAVLLAHAGLPPTPSHECCHGDGDPWNNDPSNLRWGTRKENIDDRERHGRSFRPRLRLTDAEVEDVRRRYGDGQSCREIGRELRIHESYVSRLVRGQRRAP